MLKFKEFVLILGFLVNFYAGWNSEDYDIRLGLFIEEFYRGGFVEGGFSSIAIPCRTTPAFFATSRT